MLGELSRASKLFRVELCRLGYGCHAIDNTGQDRRRIEATRDLFVRYEAEHERRSSSLSCQNDGNLQPQCFRWDIRWKARHLLASSSYPSKRLGWQSDRARLP